MHKRGVLRKSVVFLCLVMSFIPRAGVSEDAMDLLRTSEGTRSNTISLNYRQMRFERVLQDLERMRPGINVKIKAESFQEEQELLSTPVSMGPLSGVTWDTALRYVADRMGLIIDRSQQSSGVIFLEKVARFTDTFDGVRLGEAVREIASRGNANVIFSPMVGTDAPVYLSFTDVPWREALESVLKAHSCTVLYDADGRIMRIATSAEADIQFETRSRPLRYVQPEGSHFQPEIVKDDHQSFVGRKGSSGTDVGQSLINVLEQVKSERGNVTYESRTNTLVIRDTPVKIQEMMRLVDEIDQAPQQVLIEARLLSMEENPSLNLGVRWGGDGEDGSYAGITGGVTSGPSWATSFPFSPSNNSWGNLGAIFRPTNIVDGQIVRGGEIAVPGGSFGKMDWTNLSFLIQAAKFDESIQITQAPQILVLDNEEASVFIGSLRTYGLAETTVDEGVISTSIEQKEILVGVQLLVIPHVCRGTDQVIIEIIPKQTDEPVISEVNAGNISVDLPTRMNVKTVHTKMMLHSTETGVIAGLFRNEITDQKRAIPGLSRIPVLGKLFEHNYKGEVKVNSMILVTPTIIPPEHSDEFDRDIELFKDSLANTLYASTSEICP